MNKLEIIKTAQRHADVAIDGGFVADGRDDLVGTLNDEGYAEFIAWCASRLRRGCATVLPIA